MKKVIAPQKWWGKPMTKQCRSCDSGYEYYKIGTYLGKSPSLCPECQINYKERTVSMTFSGNANHRPGGHKTRQQHKRVSPHQL